MVHGSADQPAWSKSLIAQQINRWENQNSTLAPPPLGREEKEISSIPRPGVQFEANGSLLFNVTHAIHCMDTIHYSPESPDMIKTDKQKHYFLTTWICLSKKSGILIYIITSRQKLYSFFFFSVGGFLKIGFWVLNINVCACVLQPLTVNFGLKFKHLGSFLWKLCTKRIII